MSSINVDDYQTYTRWINDENLASGFGNFRFNFTELGEKEWLENCSKNTNLIK